MSALSRHQSGAQRGREIFVVPSSVTEKPQASQEGRDSRYILSSALGDSEKEKEKRIHLSIFRGLSKNESFFSSLFILTGPNAGESGREI